MNGLIGAIPVMGLRLLLLTVLLLLVGYPIYFIGARGRARRDKRPGPAGVSLLAWLFFALMTLAFIVPNFLTFNLKAKQSEARTNLPGIYTAQRAYQGDKGEFAAGPDAFAIMGWGQDSDRRRYSYFCGESVVQNAIDMEISMRPGVDWPLAVKPAASRDAFTCLAVGNLDGDVFLDVWSINDAKALVNQMNDVDNTKADDIDPADIRLAAMLGALGLLLLLIVNDMVKIRRGAPATAVPPGPEAGG